MFTNSRANLLKYQKPEQKQLKAMETIKKLSQSVHELFEAVRQLAPGKVI